MLFRSKYLKTSNDSAAKSGFSYGSQLMTDISGFGLASHLGDICQSSNLSAQINLKNEILINNNLEILKNYESSGYKNNYLSSFDSIDIQENHPLMKIIFDPQTNGPLLIAIDKEKKNEFKRGDFFNTKHGTILVYIGNNHVWFHCPIKLYNLLKECLELQKNDSDFSVTMVGGADQECFLDVETTAKALGLNIKRDFRFIYSAKHCPIK